MTKRVLLIEDFPVIQNLYGDALNNAGFAVDIAADGKTALDKVGQYQYDVVLVDLLLPNVNGIQFLEQFTNRPPQTSVFILSDFTDPKSVEQAKKLGIKGYMIKAETTPSQLIEKLKLTTEPTPATEPAAS